MKNNKQALVLQAGEGRPLGVMGHQATVKLDQSKANGDYYVFEVLSPAGAGIPPHVHSREDEVIQVIEGTYEVFLGGQVYQAEAGTILHFPCGIPHGFQNVGNTNGRTLWFVTPSSNFEPFFEELGALPTDAPPDLAKVGAIFGKYGMEVLPMPEAQ